MSTEDPLKEKLDKLKEALTLSRKLLKENPKNKKKSFDNIYFVMPHIKQEYDEFEKDKTKTVIELITQYEVWVQEVAAMIVANTGKFKNPKLFAHLDESLRICESLDYSFRVMFKL